MTETNDLYIRLVRDGEGEEIAEEILRKLRATEGWFTRIEAFTQEEQEMLKALSVGVWGEERMLPTDRHGLGPSCAGNGSLCPVPSRRAPDSCADP